MAILAFPFVLTSVLFILAVPFYPLISHLMRKREISLREREQIIEKARHEFFEREEEIREQCDGLSGNQIRKLLGKDERVRIQEIKEEVMKKYGLNSFRY